MDKSIKSGVAMLDVLESWGIDHIYGIPGGSFNSIMNALYDKRASMKYIQVRHEEVGAIAASAESKLTGRIGVCFGTAGPGATHLFNGLYDAKMDHTPVLALIGQVSSELMNRDYFQEMNENPMFADVAIYNRTVMTPRSLPAVIDDAIRKAYELKGVAVVTIPVDYGYADIPDTFTSSARNHRIANILPDPDDIEAAVKLIEKARRPVLYVGQGARGASAEILALGAHYSMPIVLSVMAKGIIPDSTPSLMGTAARVSTKPANEALALGDLIVFVGSDFPFAGVMFPPEAAFIQVDIDSSKLGKRHRTDAAILGDAATAMRMLVEAGKHREKSDWFEANILNRANWNGWLESFAESDDLPLRPEPVFKEINRIAKQDAIFVTDVGNVTVNSVRLLDMKGTGQKFTTSGLFATMGYGVSGAIGAQLSYPSRQVFSLCGDGGFAMVMQDIITQVKYRLPIINVVFSNESFGFIDAEQEDTHQPKYGVELPHTDYAGAARAMGAVGYTVTERGQLRHVFDEAARSERCVVIDVKTGNRRPFPAEAMKLDSDRFTEAEREGFASRYQVSDMPTLKEILKGMQ